MSPAEAVAVVMFAAVVAYAVFGGADFGVGAWDLTAGDAERGAPVRRLIDHSIGPVWEANHVWLVFVLVFLWSGFPTAFAALMRVLAVPFWLVGLGIVLRGAGFAYRKFAPSVRWARVAGVAFAVSSVITPFFMGTIAGAVASGRVPADGRAAELGAWATPASILGGVLAVLACAFLAGVFLAAEAEALDQPDLADRLRRRSLAVGLVTGGVATIGLLPLRADAPVLFDGLTGRGLPLVAASVVAGVTTLVLLARSRLRPARATAAIAVGSVVAGWGLGQYPWLLVDELTIADGAGATATLTGMLVASAVLVVLVLPPLVYLYVLADRNAVGSE